MVQIDRASPRTRARITGVVYLLFFFTAILGAVVAPGTAKDMLAHEALFRLGFALSLISTVCYVAVVALFYLLFKPVSRTLALLAAFFGLVGCVVSAAQNVFQLAPLVVLGHSQSSSAFDLAQLHALAQMLLDLNAQAGYVALVFFGVLQLLNGFLIFRSTFLPRILGGLMALGGVGWLTFLYLPLATYLLTYLEVIGILAEAPLMLWLVVMGVNGQLWEAIAGHEGDRPVEVRLT